MSKIRYTCCLLVLSLFCCKKPYNPTIISSQSSFLVVEGLINSGNDSTLIKLSKTVKVTDTTNTINPVLRATVTVESDQNGSWSLFDTYNNGIYGSGSLNLPPNQKYRLRIVTSEGRQYLSDFIPVKLTPPIDSIGHVLQNGMVNIYLNTHDPANNTRYYRWDYHETWHFHSDYDSAWVLDTTSKTIVQRTADQNVHFCWGDQQSSNILISSTARLSNDVVFQTPITQIPITSEKVEDKYSILVKQYAITPEAYAFYQNVLKNTEKLGNIFDAQPSQLEGNIHCLTNPAEPVIGYLGVTNVQSKRVYVLASEYNSQFLTVNQCGLCQIYVAGGEALIDNLITLPVTNVPLAPFGSNLPPTAFYYSSKCCVDCTTRGTTKTPLFWK